VIDKAQNPIIGKREKRRQNKRDKDGGKYGKDDHVTRGNKAVFAMSINKN
jgi:hypothetical protein